MGRLAGKSIDGHMFVASVSVDVVAGQCRQRRRAVIPCDLGAEQYAAMLGPALGHTARVPDSHRLLTIPTRRTSRPVERPGSNPQDRATG